MPTEQDLPIADKQAGAEHPKGPDSASDPVSAETELLREEVAQQRHEADLREDREKRTEELKNRVSVVAIILTTALSFISNVKGDRAGTAQGARAAAQSARQQAAELWAYYQTKLAERTSLEVARDRLRLEMAHRYNTDPAQHRLPPEDATVKLEILKLTDYEERIGEFDADTQQVFYRVQDLEKEEGQSRDQAIEPEHAVFRYELGSKLITLALILLSVTILSNRRWLFVGGVLLGIIGILVAFDGYLLLF